jgi:hypothetical protein
MQQAHRVPGMDLSQINRTFETLEVMQPKFRRTLIAIDFTVHV